MKRLHFARLAGMAVLLGLAGLVAWWWAAGQAPAPQALAPAGEAFPWGRAPMGTSEAAHPPQATAAAPVQAPASMPARAGAAAVFDVCGLGRISLPAGVPEESVSGGVEALPAPVGSEPLAQARGRLVAGLHAAGTARARVAAQLLQRPDTEDEAAWQAWAQATLQRALAQPDPVALAWAEEACGHLPGAGEQGAPCRLGLIRARLRLEPDNAHHWAALADEDPSAAEEAWQGLLRARRWHEAPQALVLATQQALPPDVPGYLRLALGAEVGTRAGALPSPGEGFLLERCRAAVPGRQAECDAVAQLLVNQGDGTQTLALGAKLGEAAGWPAERVQAVHTELQALAGEQVRWLPETEQPLSCRGVEAWQAQLAQVAQVGELQALRQRLAEVRAAR